MQPSENAENGMKAARQKLTACPGCDLLMPEVLAEEGNIILCPRCGAEQHKHKKDSINRTAAFSLVGLFLYFPSLLLPLLTFQTFGLSETANILQSIVSYYRHGFYLVATMVFLSAVFFPFLKFFLGLSTALSLKLEKVHPVVPRMFRLYILLEDWAMIEVYLLGIMVTVIKMYHSAEIMYGLGFSCFVALVLASIGTTAVLDKKLFWALIEKKRKSVPPIELRPGEVACRELTAKEAGLAVCHTCGSLSALPGPDGADRFSCSLCGARLHSRKPGSISKTWALILTAGMLCVPANVMPIMRVDYLGRPDNSTILDGIVHFFRDGSYGVGLIILSASILVPLFKIVGLLIILLSIKFRRRRFLLHKAKMFRFIEFIGRWSMLDIFVIAILGVLVNFGFFSSIQAAPAATYFCLVVVTTMLAAKAFDSRLLWDTCWDEEHELDDAAPPSP